MEGNEECDDGNEVENDYCDTNCDLTCGNGNVDMYEDCDDGDNDDNDECPNNCKFKPAICGNGKREVNELCDDSIRDRHGCKFDCSGTLEGWYCWGGNPT